MKKIAKIEARELSKSFLQESKPVLQNITYSFERGESYAIIGSSGSGKSTLLHLLGGLDTVTSGSVLYDQKNIAPCLPRERELFLQNSLGFVFQFHYLIHELTAFENVVMRGRLAGKTIGVCEQEASDLFGQVGLTSKKSLYPGQLSGGEEQRVAILRALMNQPSFLLADEPTGNLDRKNAECVADLFSFCNKTWGMGIIICSHDEALYAGMNKKLHLSDGIIT